MTSGLSMHSNVVEAAQGFFFGKWFDEKRILSYP